MVRLGLLAALLLITEANAQSEGTSPTQPPLLTQQDCKQITRRGPNNFYVDGPVKFGSFTVTKTLVDRGGVKVGAYSFFEAIEAVCFRKPI